MTQSIASCLRIPSRIHRTNLASVRARVEISNRDAYNADFINYEFNLARTCIKLTHDFFHPNGISIFPPNIFACPFRRPARGYADALHFCIPRTVNFAFCALSVA